MSAEPSKETPPMFLAVSSAVADDAHCRLRPPTKPPVEVVTPELMR